MTMQVEQPFFERELQPALDSHGYEVGTLSALHLFSFCLAAVIVDCPPPLQTARV